MDRSTSSACPIKSSSYLHEACTLNDPIIITSDAWIVHVATQTIIGKLPSIVSLKHYAASNISITFTTNDWHSTAFTLHFPPTVLVSPETWYEGEDYGSDDEEHEDSDTDGREEEYLDQSDQNSSDNSEEDDMWCSDNE